MDISGFEAGVGVGVILVVGILLKASGIFMDVYVKKKNGNGNGTDSNGSSADMKIMQKNVETTKNVAYGIRNAQRLNHQATSNCFSNMESEQKKQTELLTDMRDALNIIKNNK